MNIKFSLHQTVKASNITLIYCENMKKVAKVEILSFGFFFNVSNTLICCELAQTPVSWVLHTCTYATWAATVGCVCRGTWAEGAPSLAMGVSVLYVYITVHCIMGTLVLYCGYAVMVLLRAPKVHGNAIGVLCAVCIIKISLHW